MSNFSENFSGLNQFMNANYNQCSMPMSMNAYRCAYPSGTRSPGLEELQASYSPLALNQYTLNTAYNGKNYSNSPVIKLQPCVKEESMTNSQERTVSYPISNDSTLNSNLGYCSKANGRCKLNSKSRVFVAGKLLKRKSSDRKTSQDTKAHSDEDGNSTDGSDDFSPSKFYLEKSSRVSEKDTNQICQNGKFIHSDNKLQEKFKTELCKNWQNGCCKFVNCSFAHGVEELAERKNLPSNYKTKICKQFHEQMYCSYGSRCQFIHLEDAESIKDSTLTSAINSLAGLKSSRKANKGRLQVFKNITN